MPYCLLFNCALLKADTNAHCNFYPIDLTISFNQSTYSVDEDDGSAQPVLVLSNPSSTDISVQVRSSNINATGE